MNILFWNAYKNSNIDNCLFELVLENNCSALVLAEYANNIQDLCDYINARTSNVYVPLPNNGGCAKIKGLIKNLYDVELVREASRYQIIVLKTSAYRLIIGMVHGNDKNNYDDRTREETLRLLHEDIRNIEDEYKTRNSIIIGDINANPFEPACVSADTLCAIPFAKEMENPTRVINGNEYHKFYNPMWKFYGSRKTPYTTYYYSKSNMVEYFWHILDQVIIRPPLIGAFDDNALKIITGTFNHKLINSGGKPDAKKYSDHLPLFCSLKEEKIQ